MQGGYRQQLILYTELIFIGDAHRFIQKWWARLIV